MAEVEESGLGPAALDVLGGGSAAARPAKRRYQFNAQYQPSREQRERGKRRCQNLEYIEDGPKRKAALNRYLNTLDKRIRQLESATGFSFVCVALPGGPHSQTPRVMGRMGTALMRGVYSDPGAAQLRKIILAENVATKPAAPAVAVPPAAAPPQPLKIRKLKASVMIKQLRTLLPEPGQLPGTSVEGRQLGRDHLHPEEWWPSEASAVDADDGGALSADGAVRASASRAVELSDKYPLKQMSVEDLGCVYDALSKHLVKHAAERAAAAASDAAANAAPSGVDVGDQPQLQPPATLAGEMFDRRPAVLKEDIKHQMMTRWRAAHPAEAATLVADARRHAQAKMQEPEVWEQEVPSAVSADGVGPDDAEAVLPGATGDVGLELGFGFEIDGPTWRPEDNLDLGLGEAGAGSSDEEEYSFEDAEDEEDFTLEPFDVDNHDGDNDVEGEADT